mmetsp:Transcript_4590/g.17293  ORF Transcript_4590/g.17293 Transcript_4590/m.17293 type:complete len:205 (+) Transcript_4590:702-1316(+)
MPFGGPRGAAIGLLRRPNLCRSPKHVQQAPGCDDGSLRGDLDSEPGADVQPAVGRAPWPPSREGASPVSAADILSAVRHQVLVRDFWRHLPKLEPDSRTLPDEAEVPEEAVDARRRPVEQHAHGHDGGRPPRRRPLRGRPLRRRLRRWWWTLRRRRRLRLRQRFQQWGRRASGFRVERQQRGRWNGRHGLVWRRRRRLVNFQIT